MTQKIPVSAIARLLIRLLRICIVFSSHGFRHSKEFCQKISRHLSHSPPRRQAGVHRSAARTDNRTYTHDANRRLTAITDPLGQQTLFTYNPTGALTTLTDPKSNTTNWAYDIENRLILKRYPDLTGINYFYEDTTSRLHSVIDPEGQIKQYGYTTDNRLAGITYLYAVNP